VLQYRKLIPLLLIVVAGASIVMNGCGKDKVVPMNNPPQGSISATKDSMGAGEVDTLTAVYTDADNDELFYTWLSGSGRLLDTSLSVAIWNAPSARGIYTIYVWVSDGTDSTQDSIRLNVDAYNPTTENYYMSYEDCENCHVESATGPSIVGGWLETMHAVAFDSLVVLGQATNENCLPCHTTGWDTTVDNGGYDEYFFPGLEGVQCGSCHGPGGQHYITNSSDDTIQSCVNAVCHVGEDPSVWYGGNDSLTGLMPHSDTWVDSAMAMRIDGPACASCHAESLGAHYDYYEEWAASPHATSNDAAGAVPGCGDDCHTAFGYLDRTYTHPQTGHQYPLQPFVYPDSLDPTKVGVSCLVCHDPHYDRYDGQLRERLGSLCAKCHNTDQLEDVGETPVHVHAAMFEGVGGYRYDPDSMYQNSLHTTLLIYQSCAACHLYSDTSDAEYGLAVNTDHDFDAVLTSCQGANCHPNATSFDVNGKQTEVSTLLDSLKGILDANPNPGTDPYDRAKFNYDFVKNDSSLGVHNPDYAIKLLTDAISNYP
jgi:predicted CXXCH cytochrome family protein